MMITLDRLTPIGRLGKPHGINGEINAYLDVDIDIDSLKRIILMIDGIYVPFFIASMRQKRSDTFIMALDATRQTVGEITDIDDSTENVLFVVATPSSATVYLPVADEFITEIDTDRRILRMNLPEGILDL